MSARDKAAEVPETLAEWREVAQRRAQRAASFGGNEAGDPKWGHDPNARILVLLDALEKAEQALTRVEALADEWDACDEHGNPLCEGSLCEAVDDLRAALRGD